MPPRKYRNPSAKKATEEGGQADPSGSGHADQTVCRCVTRALSRAFAVIFPPSGDESSRGSNAGQSVNCCSTPSLPAINPAAQAGPSSCGLTSQSDSDRQNARKETSSSSRITSFRAFKGSTIQQSTTAALNVPSEGKKGATSMKHGVQFPHELGNSPSKKCQAKKGKYTHNVLTKEFATSMKHHRKLAAKIDRSPSKKCKAFMKIPTSAADDYASILRVANSQLHLQTQQLQKMDGTLLAAKKYQLREREQQTHQTAHIEGPAFDLFNDPPPEPMGERCELCRIDLAFRPLGSLDSYNRDIPVVAVLPCGHAFHDSCLEGISNRTNPSQTPICVCCLD